MASQIEQIEASIAKMEEDCDPENPLLKSLKVKVAGLRSQQEKDKFNQTVREVLGRSWKP